MKYLLAALPILLLLSWGMGAGNCDWCDLWLLLTGGEPAGTARTILLNIRLPRLLAALLAGGMLAAAGAAAQNLFRNDLASPHVLGVVNAAALGAVLGLFLSPWLMTPLGILFGILSLLLLFLPGKYRHWDGATLILAGIAVNAFCAALTSGALYLADERLSSLVFWLLGGFWRIGGGTGRRAVENRQTAAYVDHRRTDRRCRRLLRRHRFRRIGRPAHRPDFQWSRIQNTAARRDSNRRSLAAARRSGSPHRRRTA